MKLLFDENISFRILKKIANVFPDSVQIDRAGLKGHSDRDIWNFAKINEYTIVSFDEDFFEMTLIRGFPPKVIWLRLGNTSTENIASVLISKVVEINEFISNENCEHGCLEIRS